MSKVFFGSKLVFFLVKQMSSFYADMTNRRRDKKYLSQKNVDFNFFSINFFSLVKKLKLHSVIFA